MPEAQHFRRDRRSRTLRALEVCEIGDLDVGGGPQVACGIPYRVDGQVEDRDRLIDRTPSQVAAHDIEVCTATRAGAIDLDAGTVTIPHDPVLVAARVSSRVGQG